MTFTLMPDHRTEFEPSPRRVRVYFNNQCIADSNQMMLLRETKHLPLYYFPKKDVKMDFLIQSDKSAQSDHKGQSVYWDVQVGEKIEKNAAFTFRNPPDKDPKLENYIAFKWDKMDSWFEEDEEVFVYARDPYKRVDVLHSSRHIKVMVDGTRVAETKRPWLLFETGLPTRYYFSKHDVHMELLEHSETVTRCPYKGAAHHYSIKMGDKQHKDLAWHYPFPTLECTKIQGLIGFLNEKLDIYENDKLLQRPKSPWS